VVRDPGNAHTIGVDAALELSRLLGLLPARVWVYAIAVEDRGTGDGLSPDAMRAVHEVAARVARDIDAWLLNTAVVPDGSACEGAVCTS
jgi:Ni,Fe-hydrogenase maturation factor